MSVRLGENSWFWSRFSQPQDSEQKWILFYLKTLYDLSSCKDSFGNSSGTWSSSLLSKWHLGIDAPKPVCSCTIEPPTESAFPAFEQALLELSREDPSLHFYTDPSTGQKIINGMGELHIEIVKDRFLRHYGLNVFMGPLQVNCTKYCMN